MRVHPVWPLKVLPRDVTRTSAAFHATLKRMVSDPETKTRCSLVSSDVHAGMRNTRPAIGAPCRLQILEVASLAFISGLFLTGCGIGKHAQVAHVPSASILSITNALEAHNVHVLKPLLASAAQRSLTEATLPPGTTVKVVQGKDEVSGDVARVPVVLTGPLQGNWYLLLTKSGGTWRLYGTARR
jgi:hypothetical protein